MAFQILVAEFVGSSPGGGDDIAEPERPSPFRVFLKPLTPRQRQTALRPMRRQSRLLSVQMMTGMDGVSVGQRPDREIMPRCQFAQASFRRLHRQIE